MRALLMLNPTAGSRRLAREELLGHLEAAGHSTRYVSTDDDPYKEALAESDAEIVIVVGGDGTVAKIAQYICDRTIPLVIVRAGTANNAARSLDIEGNFEDLTGKLRNAPTKRLDVSRATGPWSERKFLEPVGWDALAKVVDTGVPEASRDEEIAEGRELFAEILEAATPSHVIFEPDGHRVEGDFIFVEILNIGVTGPRVLISPSAQPGDQLLNIVYLPAGRKQEMIDWLRSEPDETPIPFKEIKARKATLIWKEGPLRIDDEVFDAPKRESEIHVEIETEGLRVCVPAVEA